MSDSKTSDTRGLDAVYALVGADASLADRSVAEKLDAADVLGEFRSQFHFPVTTDTATLRPAGTSALYLVGNSLGLQPKTAQPAVTDALVKWQHEGVEGHFLEPHPWLSIDEPLRAPLGRLLGAANPDVEVVVMNSLTVNLHLLMMSFYRPSGSRNKIIMEAKAFPSDRVWHGMFTVVSGLTRPWSQYAVESQIKIRGLDPAECLIEVAPREGESLLRTEDILAIIRDNADSVALVMFSAVQYYTGQLFDIPTITKVGHECGAMVGWDLAHATGNVVLRLHDWEVDFACLCSYKYLNAGPGGIAGAFVHEKHANSDLPRLAGWWGHKKDVRFRMEPDFIATPGAPGWQLSNPPVFQVASLRASLEVFDAARIERLRYKSEMLTAYLEALIKSELAGEVTILTPADPAARGAQLSLVFARNVKDVYAILCREWVCVDIREPHVMRVAPAPLYNSFKDAFDFIQVLKAAFAELSAKGE